MKTIFINRQLSIIICISLILCGCITKYEATGIDEVADILVVEGIITDDETTITLSKSLNLTGNRDYSSSYYVDNAQVYVECDDGTQWCAEPTLDLNSLNGRYTIQTDQLNPDRKYRLKIEMDTYEYCSDFSYPIQTPEIDSVFWMKRGRGQPVTIHVATHSQDNKVLYYRWSYREDWEINSEYLFDYNICHICDENVPADVDICPRCNTRVRYPFYCWNMEKSSGLLIGSAEKTIFGRLTDKLTEILPYHRKLAVLYRIGVKQNAISKRAFDYFANIKKNAQQSGSIFAPIPSELRGNIICITDPGRPVIGYIDVSTTAQKHRYISRQDHVYEMPLSDCETLTKVQLCEKFELEEEECLNFDPNSYGYFKYSFIPPDTVYIYVGCVDCTYHGTTQKPENWLNSFN